MKLPDWRILENHIDIYDEKGGKMIQPSLYGKNMGIQNKF